MPAARRLAGALLIVGVAVSPAQAAIISLSYAFSASGFNAGAPVDPVTGRFSVTFDNTIETTNSTVGITLTDLNLVLDSAPAYAYIPRIGDRLFIGGSPNAGILFPGTFDFYLEIVNASTAPTFGEVVYYQGSDRSFHSLTGTLTPIETTVPEPAMFSLLGLGLAGLGVRCWRQRKACCSGGFGLCSSLSSRPLRRTRFL